MTFARDAQKCYMYTILVDGPALPQCASTNNFSLCLAQGTVTQALARNNPMILAAHLVLTPDLLTFNPLALVSLPFGKSAAVQTTLDCLFSLKSNSLVMLTLYSDSIRILVSVWLSFVLVKVEDYLYDNRRE